MTEKIWHIICIILMSEVVINENVHHHKEEYEFDIIRPVLACWKAACLLLSPRLSAQYTHTSYIDSYESPCHQVLECSQRSHKRVWIGTVWVPVACIDSQTPGSSGPPAAARRLKKVLLFLGVVDDHVGQDGDLVARDVCSFGFISLPNANALADGVNSAVLRCSCFSLRPAPRLLSSELWVRGLFAEQNTGWAVPSLVEEFRIHGRHRVGRDIMLSVVSVLWTDVTWALGKHLAAGQEQQG